MTRRTFLSTLAGLFALTLPPATPTPAPAPLRRTAGRTQGTVRLVILRFTDERRATDDGE